MSSSGQMFCQTCGRERAPEARFCPNCGREFGGLAAPKGVPVKRRTNSLVAAIVAIALSVGGLYLLNNTSAGMSLKCHLLGDLGACYIEAISEPGSVQDILENVGNQI